MTGARNARGRLCAALICLTLGPTIGTAEQLLVQNVDEAAPLAALTIHVGERWSVLWNHSVDGYEVEDIYENRDGRMVLVRSHLPDFGTGLDHMPGRGRQVSDGRGGYWIEDLNEPVPGNAYVLRPGRANVNHRLRTAHAEVSLSALGAHQRLRIALTPDP